MRRMAAVAFCSIAATNSVVQQPQPLNPAERSAAIRQYLGAIEGMGFSGGALVVRRDTVLYRGAVGLADRSRNAKNTAETVFLLGSLSKQFTAAAILKLEMQGKLQTSDSISRFLPGVPADKRGITVHHLLTHTSGLAESPGGGDAPDRDAEIRSILEEPLDAPVGQRHMYANNGYTLLAAIVEQASGMPFEQYLRDNVWGPAGMHATGISRADWEGKTIARYYVGERDNGTPLQMRHPNWRIMGSGGVLSTLDDMHTWYRTLRKNMVLSAEATRKLFTPQSRGYAYGWGVRQSPAGTEIGHDGGNTNGVAADMRFLPDSNIVLISFANDDGESTLLGAVRSRLRQLALGVRIEMPPQPVASSALVARIPGPYELPGGDHIHAVVNGGRVELRPQGQVATNLLWSGEPGDVGKWRDVGARTRQVVEAGLRGDSAALRRMLPQRRRLPMILDGWRRDLEARFGAFKECVVLGSRPGGAGAPEESPTEVRMHFERGSADAVFVWVPDDLAGFALMPQRAVVFAPVSETELASYDFATGRLRRAQFDGGALVIGGVRARQAGSSQSGSAATGRGALRPGTYAVRNVSIVPMTKDTVLARHAVLVRDGRIVWIGPSSALRAPRGTRIIDGANGFLLPGLADMHTHLFSDGEEVHDSAGPAELGVMVANGVTTARFMIGTPEQLVLRKAVASGDVVGPQMWVGSPQLTGRASENAIVVTNDTEARAAVRRAAADRYDFIKLTLFITRPVYDAVVDEARRVGIKVAGHVEPAVGVARALETGQQLEHLDAYLEAVLADSAPSKASLTQGGVFAMRNWPSLDYIDNRKVDSIAGATARAGAYIDPTQHVFNTAFAIGESVEAIRARPDFALWPPRLRDGYLRAHSRYWAPANDTIKTTARRARYVDVRNRLVKAIHDSGGKIMAGSDSPEWFHAYGYGLHRELQALVAAGLSPYQALVAATRTPAEYLGASAEWGTLEVGKRADFVLVASNPLANVKNTESIRAVSVGGRWLTRPELDAMLARARRVIAPGT